MSNISAKKYNRLFKKRRPGGKTKNRNGKDKKKVAFAELRKLNMNGVHGKLSVTLVVGSVF